MRIIAFLILPLTCIDIEQRIVEQNPGKGVITKNRKAVMTTLLPIPELLDIVKAWDELVRTQLPLASPWFAYLDDWHQFKSPTHNISERVNGRRAVCVRGMKQVCSLAGVPYKSPHKLRHGHAVFGVKHARDMRELKAISQNLMRISISITDGIYGNLGHKDMKTTIAFLNRDSEDMTNLHLLLKILTKIQNGPALINKLLA